MELHSKSSVRDRWTLHTLPSVDAFLEISQ